ncbi:MAG: response regulator [Polyangiales bacterium]
MRVLLVEDSADDAVLILRHLRREGIALETRQVDREDDMLAALAAQPFDAVISDFRLPTFSGIAAIAVARAFDPDLPVIVVSGTMGEETAAETMRAGARDFVLKGALGRLGEAVRREVREARQRREQRGAAERLAQVERERLREAQVMLQTQTLARAGGWEWVREGDEVFLTVGAAQLLELPSATEVDRAALRRCFDAIDRQRFVEAVDSGRDVVELDLRATTLGGRALWLRLVARVERDERGVRRLLGAVLDITERRDLEAGIMLQDRLVAMGTIAAGVAHEINNPLTQLVASLPLALEAAERQGSMEPEVIEILQGCIEGAGRIASIVRDLKVFTRPDDSAGARCDLADVLDSVARLLSVEYRHTARLHRAVPAGIIVAAPQARVAQVLTNLLINAMQAMPRRPTRENRVEVVAERVDDTVVISVRDNGVGIPSAVRARLFTPFFTTKPVGQGTGLGLSVTRQIVQGLGGKISVESVEGEGTVFTVTLPVGDPRISQPMPTAGPTAPPRRALRLLLVDDEPLLRAVAVRVLRPHEVVEAGSVDEALSRVTEDPHFDAVLCDLMLPDRPGTDLVEELRARWPALAERCVFVSGGAVIAEVQAMLKVLPRDRVVFKPFSAEQLRDAVARVVGG